MMFEYRFYECTPGRLAQEVARMREVSIDPWPGADGGRDGESLFDRFGIPRPLGAWTSVAGRRQPMFGYLLHWESLDERDRAFPAFWVSPEWAEVRERTNDGHPMVDSIEDWLLAPSAAWDRSGGFGEERHGGLHEMRIHHCRAGYDADVADYLAEIEHRQMEVLGGRVLGVFNVVIGPDMPAIVSFIAWPDFATQRRAAERLDVEPRVHARRRRWQEQYGVSLIRSVEQTLLAPLDYGLPRSNFGIAP
ncbi:MAG: hypothetical protein GC201_01735 [Alphaproteobacteria bacterium]|nr:hypothetical protein [Alphaproteobacteria bacterium]